MPLQVEDLTYLEGEIIALTEQLNEAKAKAKHQETVAIAAKEQFLRSTADFENYRKRTVSQQLYICGMMWRSFF